MSNEQSLVYMASKKSIRKATELFQNAKKSTKRKKPKQDEEQILERCSYRCTQMLSNSTNKIIATAFSPNFALIEMRRCIMRHDWINLQRLFPLLLEFSRDKETLIWKYALTILLHSPMSSRAHVDTFLNSCVGCDTDNPEYILDQLIKL